MARKGKADKTARLITRGSHQYVVLPKGVEFKGDKVRVRKVARGVLLEPFVLDLKDWFAELGRHPLSDDFMAEWRNQPPTPKRKLFE